MTERSDPDQSAAPVDIATLYSRANVQGARYGDFSASRRQVLGQFLQHRTREQAEPAPARPQVAPPEPELTNQVPPPQPELEIRREESGLAPVMQWPAPRRQTSSAAGDEAWPTAREAVTSRWYALQSVLAPDEAPVEAPEAPPASLHQRPPMLAIFSLAGGVGKTCLAATLGRALSSLGERVLLVDTAAYGLLPFYFGSREFKPGVVRTFSAPGSPHGAESDAPVQVLSLQPERYPGDGGEHDPLLEELVRDGWGVSRVLVDLATASQEVTSRLLFLRPMVLVPILPDMSSVASLGALEGFLSGAVSPGGSEPFYLLNQFDASSPLHQDVREMLRQRLGDRLLPFVLRRSSAVSEALAEGMTVIDYAPGSKAAEDYGNLAAWVRSLAAPAALGRGGVRWNER